MYLRAEVIMCINFYKLTPMGKKSSQYYKCWQGCGIIGTLLVGILGGAATMEKSLAAAQKSKHGITVRSSNSPVRYIPKGTENMCPCKTLYMNVHSSIIHNRQNISLMNEWINL